MVADVGGFVPSVLGDLCCCGLGGVFGSGSGKPVGAAGNCSSRNGCIGNDGIFACFRKATILYTGNWYGGWGFSVPKISNLSLHRPIHSDMRCFGVSSLSCCDGSNLHIVHDGSAGGIISSPSSPVLPMCFRINSVFASSIRA